MDLCARRGLRCTLRHFANWSSLEGDSAAALAVQISSPCLNAVDELHIFLLFELNKLRFELLREAYVYNVLDSVRVTRHNSFDFIDMQMSFIRDGMACSPPLRIL